MPGPVADPRPTGIAPELGPDPVLVLVAVEFEARRLRRHLDGSYRLRTIGLAARDLRRLEPALLSLQPAAVLVTGLAGGSAPDVAPGEIVVGAEVGPGAGGAWLTPEPALRERALKALAGARLSHRAGRLLTVPQIVADPAAKAECWRAYGAVAVDMESARVCEWAGRAGLPALAVRAVADGPTDVVPPALVRAIGPSGVVRPSVVLGWAAQPGVGRAAWRLWRRSTTALDRLARFLAAFIADPP